MITSIFKKIYIGLVICLLLPGFSNSNPLPSTTEPAESNIISFLNQPGAGNHHIKKDKDDNDDDDSIKPLDDILGLNFDLFDSWAKNSKSSSSAPLSTSSVNNDANENKDHDNTITITTTISPTNTITTTGHTNIFFSENRPLQQFHNTFHRIFATIRNQISDAIEQRRSTKNENDMKNSPNITNKTGKLRIRHHHKDHSKNNNNNGNSSILEHDKNISINIINDEPLSSRLIDNSPIQSSVNNILTVDLPANINDNEHVENKTYIKLNDSQNELKKRKLSENVNDILLLMNNSNIENTIYNITSEVSLITTTTKRTTTPFIDLLNDSNEGNDNDDKMIIANNSNNLFITTGGFRNKTKAFVTFVFTPLLNIWSIAQRSLPTWIPTFNLNNNEDNNNNNMAEIILDDDSISEINPEDTGNNQTLLEVELLEMEKSENHDNNNYLNNLRNFTQRIFSERIPSVISRIRQGISLPSLPIYQNNGGPSINTVYRKLNERMPFRKEFRKYATSHINDDDDDDNDKYITKTSTEHPITTTKVNLLTKQNHLNNETHQQQLKRHQQKLQKIIDQNSNKTLKKEQEGHGFNNGNKVNNLSNQINYNDTDDENLIILNSKEYDDDDNINQMDSSASVSASPRMYTESFGIYVLELFGTIVGLTWGALSTIQNLFTKS